jgi:hypothetical protein
MRAIVFILGLIIGAGVVFGFLLRRRNLATRPQNRWEQIKRYSQPQHLRKSLDELITDARKSRT